MTAHDTITVLAPDEVFVFGSHMSGHHAGGAARLAVERFGAVVGQGEGLQGSSYAIPTMGSFDELAEAVARFLWFAGERRDLTFLVTAIGTGIAGHPVSAVAVLFADRSPNVHLPAVFEEFLAPTPVVEEARATLEAAEAALAELERARAAATAALDLLAQSGDDLDALSSLIDAHLLLLKGGPTANSCTHYEACGTEGCPCPCHEEAAAA